MDSGYVQAHMWFNLAAAGGDEEIAREGSEDRDKLAGTMTPEHLRDTAVSSSPPHVTSVR
jgi:hypothetical protein